ncbi:MAG: hypothetical protein LBQ51_05120 [Desulfovibrio sp.]|jgi:hypothetical protein|nr:hypothetical protein [Desulfovibrio sp.]
MDNFFDLATPQELVDILGEDGSIIPTAADLEAERRAVEKNPDRNLENLAYLYAGRGDFDRAEGYVDRIQDSMLQADVGRMLTHFDGYFEAV